MKNNDGIEFTIGKIIVTIIAASLALGLLAYGAVIYLIIKLAMHL